MSDEASVLAAVRELNLYTLALPPTITDVTFGSLEAEGRALIKNVQDEIRWAIAEAVVGALGDVYRLRVMENGVEWLPVPATRILKQMIDNEWAKLPARNAEET